MTVALVLRYSVVITKHLTCNSTKDFEYTCQADYRYGVSLLATRRSHGRSRVLPAVLARLRAEFPSSRAYLLTNWEQCRTLHPHVLALQEQFKASKASRGPGYLINTDQFLNAESALVSLLGDVEPDSLEAADIQGTLVNLYEWAGWSNRALASARAALEIMLKNNVPKDNSLANAYGNVGYALVSAYRAQEAMEYLNIAVSMAKPCAVDDGSRGGGGDYRVEVFLRNRGRAKQQLKRFDDALLDFDQAEHFQAKLHGLESYYDGETKHQWAKIATWQGQLDEAYKLSWESYDFAAEGGRLTHESVMAGAHFEAALGVSKVNERHRGNAGETARVKWRMAEVFEAMGRAKDARGFRECSAGVVELKLAQALKNGSVLLPLLSILLRDSCRRFWKVTIFTQSLEVWSSIP
ncbi:hypothetical protein B0H63DRAFT_449842 [Podospora didyma]|uniref:Uncharacterized protein n=1 Tax=Podospora didyma TaxID=330526 RepID=A0AAE0NQK5_9PEZI|nr:hypothetical protein B0H63DRAFT_449842 [Podospora didyma]